MRFELSLFIMRLCTRRHQFAMNAEPVEEPIDAIGGIRHKNPRNMPRQAEDLFARAPFEITFETACGRRGSDRFTKAPRPRFAENAPDHPVGFIADHVRERLL